MLAPCRLRPLPPAPTTVTLETVMLLQGEMLRPARDGKGKLTSATCVRARGGGRGRHEPAAVRTVAAGVADFKVLEVDVVDAGEAECVAADADNHLAWVGETGVAVNGWSGRASDPSRARRQRGGTPLRPEASRQPAESCTEYRCCCRQSTCSWSSNARFRRGAAGAQALRWPGACPAAAPLTRPARRARS